MDAKAHGLRGFVGNDSLRGAKIPETQNHAIKNKFAYKMSYIPQIHSM